jgi:hypothetical protein
MGVSDEAKNVIPLKFLRKIKNNSILCYEEQKWSLCAAAGRLAAKFPPSIWGELSSSVDHTTNACESFHSRFNASFYVTHPPLVIFLEVLKNFQTDT